MRPEFAVKMIRSTRKTLPITTSYKGIIGYSLVILIASKMGNSGTGTGLFYCSKGRDGICRG
jgi:hypothetical protein